MTHTLARALLLPALVFAGWQVAFQAGVLQLETLSHPTAIFQAGWKSLIDGSLMLATAQTVRVMLMGLLVGATCGLALGVLLGLFSRFERIVAPTMDALRPIPAVALLPLALLLFGFGDRFEAAIVAFGSFWPVLLMTISAVRGIDVRLLEVARLLEVPTGFRILRLVIPAALMRIFLGIRIGAGIALALAVTVEIAANPQGLGHAMLAASQSLNPALMWAQLLWVGVLGWGFNSLLVLFEGTCLGRYSVAGATP